MRARVHTTNQIRFGYKWLGRDLSATYARSTYRSRWRYTNKAWMPHINNLEMCANGYHFCPRFIDLRLWAFTGRTGQAHVELWRVAYKGTTIYGDQKACTSDLRLEQRLASFPELSEIYGSAPFDVELAAYRDIRRLAHALGIAHLQ